VKKYFNNFLLLYKNINNYGYLEIIKVIFFEVFYILKFKDFNSLNYDDADTNSYNDVFLKKTYNTPYIPTPFYFLRIVAFFFKKKKINNLLFLDLGCGYSRCQYFFSEYFKSFFFGVDINKDIINFLKKKKLSKSIFVDMNLRNQKNLKNMINNLNKIKKNKKLVVFFSNSFDVILLSKILKALSLKFDFYCILINISNIKFLSKKYKTLYNKEFNNPERNIKILKIK